MACGIECTVSPSPTYSWKCPNCGHVNVSAAVSADPGPDLEAVKKFFKDMGEDDVVEILTMPRTVKCDKCAIECTTEPETGKAVL